MFAQVYAPSTLGSFSVLVHLRACPPARRGGVAVAGRVGRAGRAARRDRRSRRGRGRRLGRHDRRGARLRQVGSRVRLLGGARPERTDRHRQHRADGPGDRGAAAAQRIGQLRSGRPATRPRRAVHGCPARLTGSGVWRVVVRADSAFDAHAVIGVAVRAGAEVSVTVRLDPKVKAAMPTTRGPRSSTPNAVSTSGPEPGARAEDVAVADTVGDRTHRGHAVSSSRPRGPEELGARTPAVRQVHRERGLAGASGDRVQPRPAPPPP
jgi:hypothetical protein